VTARPSWATEQGNPTSGTGKDDHGRDPCRARNVNPRTEDVGLVRHALSVRSWTRTACRDASPSGCVTTNDYGCRVPTDENDPSMSAREIKTGWDEFLFWGARFFTDPAFEEDERAYKLRAVKPLEDARTRLEVGEWYEPLRFGLSNKDSNPVAWRTADNFLTWATANGDAAATALRTLWTEEDVSGLARVDAFDALVPAELVARPGGLVNIAAYLLGAVDPIRWPTFRITALKRAYDLARFPSTPPKSSPGTHYGHALEFFDTMLEEAKARNIPFLDRLDAQCVTWVIAGGGIEKSPYPLTPRELADFNAFFDIPAPLRKVAGAKTATVPKQVKKPTRGFCPLCASDELVRLEGPEGDRWRFTCDNTDGHADPLEFFAS